MRVFVPISPQHVTECLSGAWQPERGFSVTAALLDLSPNVDPEELAEVPKLAAAQASLTLPGALVRGVVVVDYPRPDVTPTAGQHPAAVELSGKVPADAVVCAFVDEPAVAALCAQARSGDNEAWENLATHDLLWFDVTEFEQIGQVYPA